MLQVILGAATIGCGFLGVSWPDSATTPLDVAGLIVSAGGASLFLLGVASLGRSLTPLPRPHARAEFRQGGIFSRVRHPIYGGVILLFLGWSLAEAPLGLVPWALLAVLLDLKSRREELWLAERYPEYAGYRGQTRRRFVPWLF